ncbi:MAG: tripartite tricarboxylate transporter substrate binding protein [Alphaproteobacteria bacterium]|nr:tripartite tricarboxylate transporter substrate binding protein [Alphaproteobacteria bacterium]
MGARVALAVGVALATLATGSASAQTWPQAQPVRLIVPFAAGSTPDLVGRQFVEFARQRVGGTWVVENRAGAGGNIGADAVAKAAPDGYTLLVATNGPAAVNQFLYPRIPFNAERDLAPISMLAAAPQLLVVAPQTGITDLASFAAYARRPGGLSYGTTGSGSASHLTMELLRGRLGFEGTEVAYRSFQLAINDMTGGQLPAMIAIAAGVLGQAQAGVVRPLLITAAERSAALPQVPTAAELGHPELESYAWIGLFTPAAVSQAIRDRLLGEAEAFVADGAVRERLTQQGYVRFAPTGPAFTRYIASERERWGEIVRRTGARIED